MTVIAWDGHTLAADRRCSFGAYIGTMTKIRRVRGDLVGVCGTAAKVSEFCAWWQAGANPEKYPNRDGEHHFTALVIRARAHGPQLERYELTGHPIVIDGPQHALGSGRDYAVMAMHLGKTAADAVKLASVFDENCGNGVDTLTLELPVEHHDSATTGRR